MKTIRNLTSLATALLSGAVFALSTSVVASNKSGLSDGAIIAIYNQVNTFDIETAGLGIANAKDKQVIALAKMVQTDHTGVRQMAADLAIKLGEARTLPASRADATAAHGKILKELGSKNGAEFDKAYLKHEIQFHTGAIDAINKVLIPSAKNEELVELMKKVLPGFEHHLSETKRVAKELGYL
jgi:putative membrane protein